MDNYLSKFVAAKFYAVCKLAIMLGFIHVSRPPVYNILNKELYINNNSSPYTKHDFGCCKID